MKTLRSRVWVRALPALVALLAACPASAGVNRWSSQGPPSPFISAVALDPADARTLYAASSESGLFKSEDGGLSWEALGSGDPALDALTCLAVDTSDPSTIYLGNRNGVFLSSHDGGRAWATTIVNSNPLSSIAVDPTGSQIYVGTRIAGPVYAPHYGTPVSRSADGGKTWNGTSLGKPRAVYALLADSLSKTLFAGSDFAYSTGYYGTDYPGGGGVERTADAGATWALSATDLETAVTALASAPKSGLLYAGTSGGGFFRSTDGGASWTRLNALAGSVSAIAVDPSAPSTLYAGISEGGVWRSGDGGATWRPFDGGLTSLSVRSLAIDPSGRSLHVGTDGGGVFDRELPTTVATSCEAGSDHLCLLNSRFRVDLAAIDPRFGTPPQAQAVGQADRFGYFSFPTLTGDASLPEVFVKMIDATSLPGQGYWIFYGGLTNVRYTLVVTDTATGRMQFYDGEDFCGSADIGGFPPDPAPGPSASAAPIGRALDAPSGELALLSGRFRIALSVTDPGTGVAVAGIAIPQGDRFGYFSLPAFTGDPTLPEVFVKMVDASSLPNGDFWLFHIGLTSLRYTLTVTDSLTGAIKTYRNDPSDPIRLRGGADTHVTAAAMPAGLSSEWNGTATEIPEKGVRCLQAPIPVPTSALASQSGNRVHLEFTVYGGCFGAPLRFHGSLNGTTLDGVLQTSYYCHLEARATGTATADSIHLVSGPLEGTCGSWIGADIGLKPGPAPSAAAVPVARTLSGTTLEIKVDGDSPSRIPGGEMHRHP